MINKVMRWGAEAVLEVAYETMVKMYRHRFPGDRGLRRDSAAEGYRLALIDLARMVFTPIGGDFDALVDRDIR